MAIKNKKGKFFKNSELLRSLTQNGKIKLNLNLKKKYKTNIYALFNLK